MAKDNKHVINSAGNNWVRVRPERLVGLSSILVDVLLYVERLPERGGDALAQRSLLTTGGGFNILVDAARLGMAVAYAGRVGTGPMGQRITADLTAAGIAPLLPRILDEDSGFDIGLVEPDAERTFVTAPGTESRLRPEDVARILCAPGDVVCISGYDLCYPVSGATLEDWLPGLDPAILLALDPGPLAAEIPAQRLTRVLQRTDILSLNERESLLLAGLSDPAQAGERLLNRIAPGGLVIARAGARGCWLVDSSRGTRHIPARLTDAIDTTGAGDAHLAALLSQLVRGASVDEAARIANIAASLSVERRGPATGPTRQELQAALAASPGDRAV